MSLNTASSWPGCRNRHAALGEDTQGKCMYYASDKFAVSK
jgi:hypothetical protein